MDKEQTVAFIEEQLTAGNISKEDLANIMGIDSTTGQRLFSEKSSGGRDFDKQMLSKGLINVLYGIGAIIAIIGVAILIAQHWEDIGFVGRIFVTLGISLIAYIIAIILNKPQQRILSQVMFVIAAILAPFGSYILLNEANITFDWIPQIFDALVLSIIFGTALFISKRNILVLIVVTFASWAYYAFIIKILGSNHYNGDALKWATILIGSSYLLIAYGYQSFLKVVSRADVIEKVVVQNILYGLGTLAILGAGTAFNGLMYDLLFIVLIFAAFYGSVYLKSRLMLILGAIFLIIHIIKLTSLYFTNSVGWPVSLIVIGFLVIGVGYFTLYLNKKFISLT